MYKMEAIKMHAKGAMQAKGIAPLNTLDQSFIVSARKTAALPEDTAPEWWLDLTDVKLSADPAENEGYGSFWFANSGHWRVYSRGWLGFRFFVLGKSPSLIKAPGWSFSWTADFSRATPPVAFEVAAGPDPKLFQFVTPIVEDLNGPAASIELQPIWVGEGPSGKDSAELAWCLLVPFK